MHSELSGTNVIRGSYLTPVTSRIGPTSWQSIPQRPIGDVSRCADRSTPAWLAMSSTYSISMSWAANCSVHSHAPAGSFLTASSLAYNVLSWEEIPRTTSSIVNRKPGYAVCMFLKHPYKRAAVCEALQQGEEVLATTVSWDSTGVRGTAIRAVLVAPPVSAR